MARMKRQWRWCSVLSPIEKRFEYCIIIVAAAAAAAVAATSFIQG